MKGLLLKDFFLIRSVLGILLLVLVVVGGGMSALTSTWVLTVVATVMFGMIGVTTIGQDKTSGWSRVAGVLPVSPQAVVDSKYTLYLLLSGAGFALGGVIGLLGALVQPQADGATFAAISLAIALLSGSITIPCNFLLGEERGIVSLIIAYPLSTAVFVGASMIWKDPLTAGLMVAAAGVALYMASWLAARKLLPRRDAA